MSTDPIPAPKPSADPVPVAPVTHARQDRRGISPVWIIPIVAALLGLWLVWQNYRNKGPVVEIRFETAEGIEAGKTGVQARSVRIGFVEAVRLSEDLKGVVTRVRIDRTAAKLLRSNTRFWVVKPRFGGAGISGLGTLVSGTYIELDPGTADDEETRYYVGLENPPVTPQGVPGLHVKLVSDRAGSVGPGSPVIYRGIRVGRVETQNFDRTRGRVEYAAFIEGDYGKLINNRTRFWNASGIDVELGANGMRVRTGTLETILSGGVAFELTHGGGRADPAVDGATFQLLDSEDQFQIPPFESRLNYLLLFKDSVRGLSIGAPVELRGIRVGTVVGIAFEYVPSNPERRVPVLIAIDPGLFPDAPRGDLTAAEKMIKQDVREGMRATLRTGSLLTGQLFVDLDVPTTPAPTGTPIEEVGFVFGYSTIPTFSSGLGQLQDKLTAILDKVQALKIEDTVAGANATLAEFKETAAGLRKVVESRETQALPADLRKTLASLDKTLRGFNENSDIYRDLIVTLNDLRGALRSFDSLSQTLDRQPNSVIFGNPKGKVKPPVGKP